MILYTAQIAKWRLAEKRKIPFIDTTVKSGVKTFAPTWSIVLGIKGQGTTPITEDEYIVEYTRLMDISMEENYKVWDDLINMEEVCIMCYCPAGKFCHRHVLKDIIKLFCERSLVDFTYGGELTE